MGKEEKLSFSFSSKPSSSQPNSIKRPPENDEFKPQYVTFFDPSQTLTSSTPTKRIIPPVPNADFRGGIKKMKDLLPPPPSYSPPSETKFVLDTNSTSESTNISYGLTIQSTATDSKPQQEDITLRRFQEDMKNLPEDRGMDEFAHVPVEGFGAAILAGYGWSEGKGIGRNSKGDTNVLQYNRRAGTVGLGYVPSANDPINWRRKGREVVYKEREPFLFFSPVVRVVSGRHAGLKAEVVMRSEGSEVVLRLLPSREEVWVDEEMVSEFGSEVEEKCLREVKELEILDRKERREKRREEDNKKAYSSDRRSSNSRERTTVRWLRSHIRVRIISKDFKGGKLYMKKGEVLDVVGPTTCDISLDGSRELVQGVDQEILETVLPKYGGSVLVLYGKHKGVYGSLVERDMEEETGVVRDADSHALINVRLEEISEYVGDPSYLGY